MTKKPNQTGSGSSALNSKLEPIKTKFCGMYERRVAILNIVSRNRKASINNLAFQFDVSERTIRSDVYELMQVAGIFTKQGNGGGIQAHDDWHADMVYFTKEEIEILQEIHRLIKPLLTPQLQAALLKLLLKFTNPNIRK